MITTANPRLRHLYVVWAALENVGFGGLVYGWGSLVYVLRDEGLYLDLCENLTDVNPGFRNETNKDCHARSSKLELVYTFASVSVGVGSFVLGQVNLKWGTRTSRIIASLVFMIGAFMIAGVTNDTPWLIFPGLSCAAFGGIAFLTTNYQIANLFTVGRGAVVGILNGAFDSSDGIQLMIKFGYESGVSRRTSFLVLACTHTLTFVSTCFFLPKDFIHAPHQTSEPLDWDHKDPRRKQSAAEPEGSFRHLFRHLCSSSYLLHLCWLSVLYLRFSAVLGSMNRTLQRQLVSQDEVSRFTNILLYTMMGGIVTSPLSGAFLELNVVCFKHCSRSSFAQTMKPLVIPLALATTFGAVMSTLVLFENPSNLYAVFIFILLLRSSLFTFSCAYIIHMFPSQYLVSIIGITTLIGSSVSLFQHAIFEWSEYRPEIQANVFLLVLTCLTYIHPAWQLIKCHKLEQHTLLGYDTI
ncbi:equilibrative nucleobase transporter 1-like isoform X1 [Biomphalaria glabrata]|uniref:Equilibrative nucleobase transporter 1-like isoform X1 n=1 Tax=Biomphalaria glabrata TaxID=6526 RepID=A0A9W3BLM6_BIOGL|nr:equilibrative nucleobase transporter 1-like isoform X1 [Biomphalaria glabrata]XP_055900315.1 equilibrative nucleobase transporter 1-like isoform X1 [Biomphalaria glabrata]XP_055900316.1 equilibrative nucleobase transporter 1-like isoform X1 [Biomphalaria glabrata]XP_055900317.1 equilibrative nucleobase transporter 1-like isoform X1 [Biomphalaria glabrata]XP_055900318.1 equilibrative nucleobase transporter 1-like isoform X1 [Biomphalaria glabrata]XP_055900319.1 equilibrative nucleobase trans